MKESIKKFRDEARKLEESDALQEARRKYVSPSASRLPWWDTCFPRGAGVAGEGEVTALALGAGGTGVRRQPSVPVLRWSAVLCTPTAPASLGSA